MNTEIRLSVLFVFCCAPFFVGCKQAPPAVVQASGVVTINGKPLNKAVVSFIPMAEGLDGSHIATGTTDEDGKFTLSFYAESGVYSGLNKVTIRDESAPEGGRSLTQEGERIRQEHKASMLNRPIPDKYSNVGQTPLAFEVTPDKKEYLIEIKR